LPFFLFVYNISKISVAISYKTCIIVRVGGDRLNYREVTYILSEHGCEYVRDGKGSHKVWYSPITDAKFPVPNHGGRDITKPTLRKVQNQSGVRLL